jgi:uncharacterized phage protein (TIGR02220 family)
MAKKLTKRKAFNFLRSYYDVLNELNDDKDKLSYLLAIMDKSFLDENPQGLSFLANLCYESQRHSIESSVNGWKRAEKTDLLGNPITTIETTPMTTPTTTSPTTPKEEEEKEEEKEKEQLIDSSKLLSLYNSLLGKQARVINSKTKTQIKQRLKEGYTKDDIVNAIRNASKDPHHIEFNYKYLTLEFITRPDKLDRFVNMGDFKIKTQIL